ncbi:MAG: hypothetical protein C3F12_00010 [Candidatus Methylomirabilota bacterium]|nr:PIN domain-containing protein [Candidatus Methylomirabilis sp.]PWB48923.1 MAG: hypothetical protein C3F12_00010 [candidate division NC10 bacterium]
MRLFPDTNVLVSAIIARGLCEDLLRLLVRGHVRGRWELLIGAPVEIEFTRILHTRLHADNETMAIARDLLADGQRVPSSAVNLTLPIPDLDDIPILACALAAQADFFITGDKALLDLNEVHSMRLCSPRQMWDRLFACD